MALSARQKAIEERQKKGYGYQAFKDRQDNFSTYKPPPLELAKKSAGLNDPRRRKPAGSVTGPEVNMNIGRMPNLEAIAAKGVDNRMETRKGPFGEDLQVPLPGLAAPAFDTEMIKGPFGGDLPVPNMNLPTLDMPDLEMPQLGDEFGFNPLKKLEEDEEEERRKSEYLLS